MIIVSANGPCRLAPTLCVGAPCLSCPEIWVPTQSVGTSCLLAETMIKTGRRHSVSIFIWSKNTNNFLTFSISRIHKSIQNGLYSD